MHLTNSICQGTIPTLGEAYEKVSPKTDFYSLATKSQF